MFSNYFSLRTNQKCLFFHFQFELKEMKRRQEAAEEAERQRLQAEAGWIIIICFHYSI